jgi:hypothetical protein
MPNPIRTWGEFKRLVEGQGMRDGDLIAWIDVDAENPTEVIVYPLNGKVIEHVGDVIESTPTDIDGTALRGVNAPGLLRGLDDK